MARELNVNKSSVTRQLAILEEKGYVERRGDPKDKRSLLIYPTEKAASQQKEESPKGIGRFLAISR